MLYYSMQEEGNPPMFLDLKLCGLNDELEREITEVVEAKYGLKPWLPSSNAQELLCEWYKHEKYDAGVIRKRHLELFLRISMCTMIIGTGSSMFIHWCTQWIIYFSDTFPGFIPLWGYLSHLDSGGTNVLHINYTDHTCGT